MKPLLIWSRCCFCTPFPRRPEHCAPGRPEHCAPGKGSNLPIGLEAVNLCNPGDSIQVSVFWACPGGVRAVAESSPIHSLCSATSSGCTHLHTAEFPHCFHCELPHLCNSSLTRDTRGVLVVIRPAHDLSIFLLKGDTIL